MTVKVINIVRRFLPFDHFVLLVLVDMFFYTLMCLTLVQDCEASPHCRRLQLKDMLVAEMQRLTKYPLLLDNIIKYTEGEESGDTQDTNHRQRKTPPFPNQIGIVFRLAASSDLPSLQRAQACCRGILQAVNEVVRETEHRQSLIQYQRRLDAAPQFKVTEKFRCLLFLSPSSSVVNEKLHSSSNLI